MKYPTKRPLVLYVGVFIARVFRMCNDVPSSCILHLLTRSHEAV